MVVRARQIDAASLAVVVVTLILFSAAVAAKGLTHDLLLEAGVFLVSVKLILMNAKSNLAAEDTVARLESIQTALERLERGSPGGEVG